MHTFAVQNPVTVLELNRLTLNSTLADLPCHDLHVSAATPGEFVLDAFEQDPVLPGVILIDDKGSIYGVVSRVRFFEYLDRPYGRKLFLSYPISVLWRTLCAARQTYLRLSALCLISEAAEILLKRPGHLMREPIVIEIQAGEYRLLDAQVVLLAQSRILAVANQVIRIQTAQLQQQVRDRQAIETALRDLERRYSGIFEHAMEGIYQTTPEGRFLNANPALAQIYGYSSPEELISSAPSSRQVYVNPIYREELLIYLRQYDAVTRFESQVYRKDGSIIWISENVRTVKDSIGNVLYYEGTVQEITESKRTQEELNRQRQTAERLLLNILPRPIAERLETGCHLETGLHPIADQFANVTVLFADIVDFSKLVASIPPEALVDLLNRVFSRFDRLVEQSGLERIKTIGDAYMVAAGLPIPRADHAEAIADVALQMQSEMNHFCTDWDDRCQIRIGIDVGQVVAGVIGGKRFIYDLWGDTVNIANSMKSQGKPGQIQVTEAVYKRLKGRYILKRRGAIVVQERGKMTTYWLMGRKAPPS